MDTTLDTMTETEFTIDVVDPVVDSMAFCDGCGGCGTCAGPV